MSGSNTPGQSDPARASYLREILERKGREVARRRKRDIFAHRQASSAPVDDARGRLACAALRRQGRELPSVIAEIKLRSPSAGLIRQRVPGEITSIARGYQQAGASAVSVLADGPAFGGCALDVRRIAAAVSIPVLFKEFVLDPCQIALARLSGAHMVLLIARALGPGQLGELVQEAHLQGLAPVVEVTDEAQLQAALLTPAKIIGVNARDLTTFRVNPAAAASLIGLVPGDRIKVYMSGVASKEDLARVADTEADAVLIGEALMRAPDPGARLKQILGGF